MSRFPILKPIVRVFATATVLTTMFGVGIAAGFHFYPQVFVDANHDDHDHDVHDDHDPHDEEHNHEEEEHVALTEQAFGNLQLVMGHASRGDYWKSMLVPAQVVEIPGRSDLSVSAPVAGIVQQVFVVAGQSLRPNQPLFEIQLTDQSLTDAQSELLATVTRQEVARAEITRLAPLALSGAVTGTKKRELEYELTRLRAQQTTLAQQLRGRGFPEALIAQLLKEKSLATSLTVYAPDYIEGDPAATTSGYSIEDLNTHPGMSVERGVNLCSVAYHAELHIEGTAFEDDIKRLNKIVENDWEISVELHHSHEGHTDHVAIDSVKLLRIDNHVNERTQSVHFYMRLKNSVIRTQQDGGNSFEQWRFRPGQKLHLRLPVERWSNQITVPADAVVIDGPNVLVFAEHHHDHDEHDHDGHDHGEHDHDEHDHDGHDHGEHDHDGHEHEEDSFIELEPVPVRLLHRDDQIVVIADDGQVTPNMEIAMNNAHKLYLAMKMQAGGGGGHHHDH